MDVVQSLMLWTGVVRDPLLRLLELRLSPSFGGPTFVGCDGLRIVPYFRVREPVRRSRVVFRPHTLVRSSGRRGGSNAVVSALVSIFSVDFSDLSKNPGALISASLLGMLAAVMLLLGLVGLYASQARAAGVLGLVGFLLAFLGTVFVAGFDWSGAFLLPNMASEASRIFEATPPGFVVTFLLFAVGWLVFGLAMLQARIYPRVVALVLVAGAVINFVPVAGTEFVFAFAIAWAGVMLFTGRGITEAQPPSRVN